MTRFSVDFTGVTEGGAARVPEGLYKLRIKEAKVGQSKKSQQPTIATIWTIRNGNQKGQKLNRIFSLQPQALFSIRNMLIALGYEVPAKRINLDTSLWIDKECGGRIQDRTYDKDGTKKTVSEIAEFITLAEYEQQRTPSEVELPATKQVAQSVVDLLEDEESEIEESEDEEVESEEKEDSRIKVTSKTSKAAATQPTKAKKVEPTPTPKAVVVDDEDEDDIDLEDL